MIHATALKGIEQNSKIKPVGTVTFGSVCGYISAMILASSVKPELATIEKIRWFIDFLEPRFGEPGVGEKILKNPKLQWIVSIWKSNLEIRLGRFLECYAEGLKEILFESNIEVTLRINGDWKELDEVLLSGRAVMLGTSLTKAGHFIVLTGIETIEGVKFYTVIDSNGNWNTGYKDKGIYNRYEATKLVAHCGRDQNAGKKPSYIFLTQRGI
ncbi:hypothetical protein CH379_017915 [Leptospira ellisii]|uniref:Peptidase C39-like domain-containing protein n=1 Tax=Leptospira ellisii TaxID=2023197 RepID=A0A2N0BHM3_9LEPT|nr:hypothetical protein [Leptospira ellisii]MDV6237512.1 hypothetical protein [Leptospira ellisii]PJZ91044.1 hypothetical protein CH379_20870 [Leptospira ellisii]PKA03506.1 hypothetical protein CH375_16565 [Leptospira ellisii]